MTHDAGPAARVRLPGRVPAGRGTSQVAVSRKFLARAKQQGLGAVTSTGRTDSGIQELISISNHPHAIASQRFAAEMVRRVAGELDLGRVTFTDELRWSSHHHLGGGRLGDDRKTRVVDRNLRVHGTPASMSRAELRS